MANEVQMWSPFRELDRFRRDFDDLIDRFFGNRPPGPGQSGTLALESFVDNGKLVIRADLPGIDPKDVDITVTGDQLTIQARRERRQEKNDRDFIHRELSYGSFMRTVKLPAGIKPNDVKAAYRDGVLELTAPLPEEAKARSIPVQVEGKATSTEPAKS
ncbi:MAG: Hsp20/alpha crystallin family protein [Candidatus Binataceae bacterium]